MLRTRKISCQSLLTEREIHEAFEFSNLLHKKLIDQTERNRRIKLGILGFSTSNSNRIAFQTKRTLKSRIHFACLMRDEDIYSGGSLVVQRHVKTISR